MATVSLAPDWQDASRLKTVLQDFNTKTIVTEEGAVTFPFLGIDQTPSLLVDAFRYPSTLSAREVGGLIDRALIDLRKLGPVQPPDLIARLCKAVSAALSVREKPFTMWTALRLTHLDQSGGFRLSYRDVALEARHGLPKWLKLDNYLLSGFKDSEVNRIRGFSYLVCRTQARNEDDAAKRIFEATDIFMAVTNVAWRQWNVFGGEHHPEAKLWEGPYQFFWEAGRFLCSDKIWFNSEFDLEEWNRHPKKGTEFRELLPKVREGLAALERHPLSTLLSQALRLMQDGMTARDTSYRLLRFWSALETLFARPGETRADKIIERALFAEEEPALPRVKLEYLNKIRNRYVHAGLENDQVYHLVQFLRDLVANHLMYLLYNGSDFSSHGEYLAMCDLPGSLQALESRRRAIERRENVIRLRRHKPSPKRK
jgi:hypothetical protein